MQHHTTKSSQNKPRIMAPMFSDLEKIQEHFQYDRSSMGKMAQWEEKLIDHLGNERRYQSLIPLTMNGVHNTSAFAQNINDFFTMEFAPKMNQKKGVSLVQTFVEKCPTMQKLKNGHEAIHDKIKNYLDVHSRNICQPFCKNTKHSARLTDNPNVYLDYASVISKGVQFQKVSKQLDVYIIPHSFNKYEPGCKRKVNTFLNKLNAGNMQNVMISDPAFRKRNNYKNGITGTDQLFRDFKQRYEQLDVKPQRVVLIIKRGRHTEDTADDTLYMFEPETKNTLPTEGDLHKFTDLCWYHNSNGEVVPANSQGKEGLSSKDDGVLNWSWHSHENTTKVYQYYGEYGSLVRKFNFKEMLEKLFEKSKRKYQKNTKSEFELNYQSTPDSEYERIRSYFSINVLKKVLNAKAQEFVPFCSPNVTDGVADSTSLSVSVSTGTINPFAIANSNSKMNRKCVSRLAAGMMKTAVLESITECEENTDPNKSLKPSALKPLIEFKQNDRAIKSSALKPVIELKQSVTAIKAMKSSALKPVIPRIPVMSADWVSDLKLIHGSRANLNIYMKQEQTENLLKGIAEKKFNNARDLYYYIDYTVSMQVIDGLAKKYVRPNGWKIAIVNIELHDSITGATKYLVCIPNDTDRDNASNNAKCPELPKWEWKLDEFMTNKQIKEKYGISTNLLPLGSRQSNYFQKQRKEPIFLRKNFVKNIKWNKLLQYSSKTKGKFKKNKKNGNGNNRNNTNGAQLTIHERDLVWYVYNSYFTQRNELLPIVIMENKKFKIHKVLPVYLEHLGINIGITFKFNKNSRQWEPRSICLDPGDILNKWRLVGAPLTPLISNLNQNNKSIRKLQIITGI